MGDSMFVLGVHPDFLRERTVQKDGRVAESVSSGLKEGEISESVFGLRRTPTMFPFEILKHNLEGTLRITWERRNNNKPWRSRENFASDPPPSPLSKKPGPSGSTFWNTPTESTGQLIPISAVIKATASACSMSRRYLNIVWTNP